jgi:hypothetical protein
MVEAFFLEAIIFRVINSGVIGGAAVLTRAKAQARLFKEIQQISWDHAKYRSRRPLFDSGYPANCFHAQSGSEKNKSTYQLIHKI